MSLNDLKVGDKVFVLLAGEHVEREVVAIRDTGISRHFFLRSSSGLFTPVYSDEEMEACLWVKKPSPVRSFFGRKA